MTLRALLMYRRFLRIQAPSWHHKDIYMLLKVTLVSRQEQFGTSCVNGAENDDSSYSTPASQTNFNRTLLSRRRKSLSPLERVSSLLPKESLTPEVEQLRTSDQHNHENDSPKLFENAATHFTEEVTEYSGINKAGDENVSEISDLAPSDLSECMTEQLPNGTVDQPSLKGETLLKFGEILVAEYRKKGQIEFRKMFQLLAQTLVRSSWGVIPHEDIAEKPAGSIVKTNRGVPILIRRASLEDFVLFMKRGPAIAYPKEATAMLMMMDVTEGDCVLEAGSGSGAMSLFLSRAVGASGRVMSVEVREDHLRRAVLNYNRWRTSWELRRGQPWPDNVEFVQADLCTATSVLQGHGFHAVSLDLIHPHLVLPTIVPHLHCGAVCAVYLANITQVIDLLEGLRCLRLPLLCERIVEFPSRDWIVAPAFQKDGSYCMRKSPMIQENSEKDDEHIKKDQTDKEEAFGSIPYIARPHPEQISHAAFLVKLRKYVE